jgi:uncharacterized peroxidase-related enzyme
MQRIPKADPAALSERGRELLSGIKPGPSGDVANIYQTMVQSPAALGAVLAMNKSLQQGELRQFQRELLAVYVGELNGCRYCVSAHSLGAKNQRLAEEEILAARRGESADPKMAAMLRLAKAVLESRGAVADAVVAGARAAGLTDGELVEVCANVAANVYTNLFNNLAQTEIDFPPAPPLA